MRARLAEVATTPVWRFVLASIVAVLVYWSVAGGAISYWPGAQVALVVGLAAGLIAPGVGVAACVGGGAYVVGVLTGAQNFLLLGTPAVAVGALLPWAVAAAASAAGARFVVGHRWLKPEWILWAAVGVVLGNVWVTVFVTNQTAFLDERSGVEFPALTRIIDGAAVPLERQVSDDYYYLTVFRRLRAGQAYYPAASEALSEASAGKVSGPSGFLNLRQPLLPVMLATTPNAQWLIAAYLALLSAASLSVFWLLRGVVRTPVALPAVFGVIAYALPHITWLTIFYAEVWAGPLTLISLALFARSLHAVRWRVWLLGAVGVAVFAFLVREFAGTLFIAGVAAALCSPKERRHWTLGAWLAGGALAAAAYAAHAIALRPFLTGESGHSVWGYGGVAFSLSALTYNTFALGTVVAVSLAVLGYIGAALMPRLELRVFALLLIVMPPMVFLFVGNGVNDPLTGSPINYWGAAFVPVAYACLPAALSVVPGSTPSGQGVLRSVAVQEEEL